MPPKKGWWVNIYLKSVLILLWSVLILNYFLYVKYLRETKCHGIYHLFYFIQFYVKNRKKDWFMKLIYKRNNIIESFRYYQYRPVQVFSYCRWLRWSFGNHCLHQIRSMIMTQSSNRQTQHLLCYRKTRCLLDRLWGLRSRWFLNPVVLH